MTELNRIDNDPLSFERKEFSGRYLMNSVLDNPMNHNEDYHTRNDYASRVLLLEKMR